MARIRQRQIMNTRRYLVSFRLNQSEQPLLLFLDRELKTGGDEKQLFMTLMQSAVAAIQDQKSKDAAKVAQAKAAAVTEEKADEQAAAAP